MQPPVTRTGGWPASNEQRRPVRKYYGYYGPRYYAPAYGPYAYYRGYYPHYRYYHHWRRW